MISFSAGFSGQNPNTKLRILKKSGEVLSASGLSCLVKSMAAGALGAGLPRNCDKGCTLYPAWIFLTFSIEELRPVEDEGKFCLRPDYRLDARRRFALPVWTSKQEASPIIARGAASYVGEVESVHVDELERVVTLLFNGWHREDERFRSEVRTQERVRCIGIRRLDRLVVRCIDSRGVAQRIPWHLEFGIAAVNEVRVLDTVAVHERETVDVRLAIVRASSAEMD
jgi:hypothetical protein